MFLLALTEYESTTVVVIPLSSQSPEIWPLRLKCEGSFLDKTSYAVIPGIRQVSKTRLEEYLGEFSEATLKKLGDCVSYYLAD